MAKPKPARPPSDLFLYLLLALAVFAVFSPVLHFDFVSYDDPDYVLTNAHVHAGLTLDSIRWAFTSGYANNSFPLTWISHMLDWDLFGPEAGWHHFTNLLLHALSTLLLFAALNRMTAARWRSALVALLFGLHPLHVESVAWVAERKDVLSGFFWMLTLWSYAAYAQRSSRARYLVTLFLFCLGLLSKPMLVTLPLILLALDDWPLRRGFHIVEKAPFFAASLAASVMAFLAQRSQGATVSVDTIPLLIRFENALVSYATYILQALWPADLAVFYPYPLGSSAVPALIAGVVLAAVTALAIRELRRYPYLGVGWFWYVITLGPVIGLVQIGAQSHADRYTYIPLIGFFIAAVWGLNDLLAQWPRARTALAATAAAACLLLTWFQVQYWKDSVTLYRHTIAAVPGSYIARFNLATVLASEGNTAEAIDQLRETIRLRPGYADAHGQLGLLLARDNHPEQGLAELQTAVRLNPNLVDAHLGLGSALGALGRPAAAAAEFNRAIQLEPDNAGAHYNLAIALSSLGRFDDAAAQFSETVRLTPDDADARFNFGVTLARLGRFDAAAEQLTSALRLRPNFAEAHSVLQDIQQRKRGTR